ncbi:hypothetical protein GM3708_1677 [Geminocystis sp. NIES-3708]|nr:hypothetical protein GM3708_1677 [Geminocystis sp. NIES-3708]
MSDYTAIGQTVINSKIGYIGNDHENDDSSDDHNGLMIL